MPRGLHPSLRADDARTTSSTGTTALRGGASGALDELDRLRCGQRPELLTVLPDRRQRRVRERGRLEIVEADDGQVVARLEAEVPRRLQRCERHQIGGRGDCTGLGSQRASISR